jgi:hypothetical protein
LRTARTPAPAGWSRYEGSARSAPAGPEPAHRIGRTWFLPPGRAHTAVVFSQSRALQGEAERMAKQDLTPADESAGKDNELHAPAGEICAHCNVEIQPGELIRRTVKGTWVHQAC